VWFVRGRVLNEETASSLADPLHQPLVIAAAEQGVDPVQRVGTSAAGRRFWGFGPLVNHGEGQSKFRRNLLGTALLKYFAQQLMGLHAQIIQARYEIARSKHIDKRLMKKKWTINRERFCSGGETDNRVSWGVTATDRHRSAGSAPRGFSGLPKA
jgi:hypothetical protein